MRLVGASPLDTLEACYPFLACLCLKANISNALAVEGKQERRAGNASRSLGKHSKYSELDGWGVGSGTEARTQQAVST